MQINILNDKSCTSRSGCILFVKAAGLEENIIQADKMPHSVASDLGLHCLFWPDCIQSEYNNPADTAGTGSKAFAIHTATF